MPGAQPNPRTLLLHSKWSTTATHHLSRPKLVQILLSSSFQRMSKLGEPDNLSADAGPTASSSSAWITQTMQNLTECTRLPIFMAPHDALIS